MTRTARERLRDARDVRRERDGRPAPSEIAYGVYVGVLVAAIVGVPIVRAIVLGLMSAPARATLFDPASATLLSLGGGALLGAAMLAGRTRGPVLADPFHAWVLTSLELRGRTTLRATFVRGGGTTALALTAIAGIVCIALALGGGVSAVSVWRFFGAAALFAVLAVVAWLAGQSLRPNTVRLGATGIALLVAVSAAAPAVLPYTPWGWLGALWPPAASATGAAPGPLAPDVAGPVALIALAAAAALTLAAAPSLLDRISPATALWQASRWQAALTLARTGDAAATLAAFGTPGTRGRGIHLALPRVLPLAYLARDGLVALRRPARIAVGAVALTVAGGLLGIAARSADATAPALAGALLAFLALGPFCDGLRHAADAAGRPPLLGVSARADAAMHALLPLVAAIVLGGLGALLLGAGSATWWVVAAIACLVLVRAMDAAKGPLPIELMMPVPTPMGDASVMVIALWQSDAILVALLLAGGLTIALPSWGAGAWIALLAAAALIAALANARFGRAGQPQGADR